MENLVFLATEHSSHQGFNLGNMAIKHCSCINLISITEKICLGQTY